MADENKTDAELVDWTSLEDHAGPEVADLREKLAESQRWRRRQAERITDLLAGDSILEELKEIHVEDGYGRCIGCTYDDNGPLISECVTNMIIAGVLSSEDVVTHEEQEDE
jgi:hypothetical protein